MVRHFTCLQSAIECVLSPSQNKKSWFLKIFFYSFAIKWFINMIIFENNLAALKPSPSTGQIHIQVE